MSPRYPVHVGCGGPLVPAESLPPAVLANVAWQHPRAVGPEGNLVCCQCFMGGPLPAQQARHMGNRRLELEPNLGLRQALRLARAAAADERIAS